MIESNRTISRRTKCQLWLFRVSDTFEANSKHLNPKIAQQIRDDLMYISAMVNELVAPEMNESNQQDETCIQQPLSLKRKITAPQVVIPRFRRKINELNI